MGGFVSQGLEAVSTVAGLQSSRQARKVQAEQVAAQNQYMAQQQAVQEKQRRDLMQRQLATARARLSAGGVGIGAGSGNALLAGMVKGGEQEIADSQALLHSRQANAGIGLGSGDGLLEGLTLARKGLSLFAKD